MKIDNEATVLIIQVFKHVWQITTRSGYVLQNNITVSSDYEAEAFVRNYVSSFPCWNYVVIPLENVK